MQLTAKLVSILVVAIAIVFVLDGVWAVQREVALFRADMQRDSHLLGAVLKGPIEDAWRSSGENQALQLVRDARQRGNRVSVRWVWLDNSHNPQFRPHVTIDRLVNVCRGEEVSLSSGGKDAREFLYTYVPIDTPDEISGALEIRESLAPLDDYVRKTMLRTTAVVGLSVMVSAVGIVVLGAWSVGRPLDRLSEKARRIGSGDLSGPLSWRHHDEFADLARTMDTMCQRLVESQENMQAEHEQKIALLKQVRHADRLRTVGRLAAGVAHELGTPLNTISIHSGMIASRGTSDAETLESANVIKAQSRRMTEIVQHLLDYARRRSAKKHPTDLRTVVQATIEMLARFCNKRNAKLCWRSVGAPPFAAVDTGQIEQVLTNLIVNAVQAMPNGGDVQVELKQGFARAPAAEDEAKGDFVGITVRDEGIGISEANKKHIFDPFFTTKDVGQGTGLGLSIAYGIVQEHGGWIDVESTPGQGSCFTVFLPAATSAVAAAASCR